MIWFGEPDEMHMGSLMKSFGSTDEMAWQFRGNGLMGQMSSTRHSLPTTAAVCFDNITHLSHTANMDQHGDVSMGG